MASNGMSAGLAHAAALAPIELRIVRSAVEIDSIAGQWHALAPQSGPALSEPEWYAAAIAAAHHASDEPSILTAWRSGELMALAPLIFVRGAGRYEIIGSHVLYEPMQILARDVGGAGYVARQIVALGRPVLLSRLPAESAFNDAFRAHASRAGWLLSPGSSGSRYVELSGSWQRYYDGLPSRLRNIIRRAHRALGKLGRVEFEFIKPSPAQVAEMLQSAFDVELRSWKGRAGSAVLQRPNLRQFFVDYAARAAARDELLVSFMRFDGAPIAMQVAGTSRRTYWQLKIGYDETHSKHLPGLQLQLETLRWSFEHGLATYEFLGTDEPWLREWTNTVRAQRTWLFYPYNWRGGCALLRDTFARGRRKLAARLTPGPRT